MGIQENVMASWKVLPDSLKFVTLVTLGTAFFSKMAGIGLMEHTAVQSDVLASSMSFLSMHKSSQVNLTWDQTPFVMAVPDGSLIMMYQADKGSVSPYPLTIPPNGSVDCKGLKCFKGKKVESFSFVSRDGEKEVFAG